MFWIYGIEKFNNNLVIVGKNNNSKEQQMADKNEKPMYSNILKIIIKNKAINIYSKIIKDIFPKIL